jgi:hypothetical protein
MKLLKWQSRAFALITLSALTNGSAATLNNDQILKELQARYGPPFQSIYVTDDTLNDLTVHFSDDKKVSVLVNLGFSQETLNAFKKFLDTVVQRGFLQVDLLNVKAGIRNAATIPAPLCR